MTLQIRIEKRSQIEWLYLIYFMVMLAHGAIPYLKFVLWAIIILLTSRQILLHEIGGVAKSNFIHILLWYGIFFLWVNLSKLWAYVERPNADIVETMIRVLPILVSLAIYLDSYERIFRMLDIIVLSVAYFSVVYLATSPISTWGSTSMGGITGQFRNFSAYLAAMAVIMSFFLLVRSRSKKYLWTMLASGAVVIFSGSRGALFSLAVMIVCYAMFEDSFSKRFKHIMFGILVVCIGAYFLFTNQYLYTMYGSRILSMLGGTDGSAEDRSYYVEIGFQMFLQKPWLGWGLDNFSYYLRYFCGYPYEVYSHCNYIEILSCYGAIGAVMFYWPYFMVLFSEWKYKSKEILPKLSIVILIRFFIFEYSTITYNMLMYVVILTVLICGSNVIKRERGGYFSMKPITTYFTQPYQIFEVLRSRSLTNFIPDSVYLGIIYKHIFNRKLDLENPLTFNEKMQWLKINDRNPQYVEMVDKAAAKQYVASRIGSKYIIPTLQVWENVEEIDFEILPDQFVLKCTHDSGGVIVCKDKKRINLEKTKEILNRSMKRNFYYYLREWPYKNVKPRIIAEKLLVDERSGDLRDYKFFCFNGKVKCFKIDFDRFKDHHANYYDCSGNLLPFGELQYCPKPEKQLTMPHKLEEMIRLAERLANGFPFLRVDFYEVDDNVFFGELTLYPASGFGKFTPPEWDNILGDWLAITRK